MEKRSHNAYFMRPELREKKLLYHYCGFGGGLKLTFKNPRSYRPAVTFAIGDNYVPLEKRNAVFTCDIPENNSAPENEVVQVRVTGCRVDHNSKSRIFCEQSSYRFIKSGSSKI